MKQPSRWPVPGWVVGLAVSGSLLAGCAGTRLTSSSDLQALRARQEEMARAVAELRQSQAAQADQTAKTNGEIVELAEGITDRLDRLENQLRDLLDGLSRSQIAGRKTGSDRPLSTTTAGSDTAMASSGSDADARELYEAAYIEVTRSHYDLAITSFQEFLKSYPESDLADNALYWIGEAYYVQREFQPAVDAFVRLMDAYPQGDKVPAALLKLGFAFGEQGDPATAQRYLQKLVTDYPQSDEAQKAKERLAQR